MTKESQFKEPSLAINRVYTKKGDKGETRLVGGQRVSKGSERIESYGTIDELNAYLGMTIVSLTQEKKGNQFDPLKGLLERIQHQLFNLGSILATLPQDVGPHMPRITEDDIRWLEREIDTYNNDLPPLRSFVLPGGTQSGAYLHICRTVCRRAERILVRMHATEEIDELSIAYINRLSDAFFVWSRWVVIESGTTEVLWNPNSGRPPF